MQIRLIFILCFFCSSLQISSSHYNIAAKNWLSTYVLNTDGSILLTNQEINILLNLVYLSFQRSTSTIIAQKATLDAENISWQIGQNVAQTRRNPSKQIPYAIGAEKYHDVMAEAWKQQQQHCRIGTLYAQFSELVIKHLALRSNMTKAIEALREQARVILINQLSDLKKYLDALIEVCNKKGNKRIGNQSHSKRLSFIDYVWSLLPPLAIHSFVQADHLSIKASEEGWAVLAEIQQLDNHLWHMIETARSAYYAAIYNHLIDCIQQNKLPPEVTVILTVQENQLTITDPVQQLPTMVYPPRP